jgi:hypothetical protein
VEEVIPRSSSKKLVVWFDLEEVFAVLFSVATVTVLKNRFTAKIKSEALAQAKRDARFKSMTDLIKNFSLNQTPARIAKAPLPSANFR